MKMKENETLNEFSSRFMELVNQMKSYGEEISDKRIVEKLLIIVIEETKDLSPLNVQELFGSLKLMNRDSLTPKMLKEMIHQEVAELDEEEQDEEMEVEEDSTMEESSLMKKAHHSQSVIFVKEVVMLKKIVGSKGSLNASIVKIWASKNNVWFLDNGCTNHMIGNKNIFLDMDTTINSQVKMGNGDLVNVKGKDTVGIQTKVGTKYIRDVLLVPALEQNLLSVGQLVEHGYKLHFEDNECTIYDKEHRRNLVKKIKMEKNRSFPIVFKYAENVALRMEDVEEAWLWHRRFGYLNFNSLKMLCQRNMVQDCQTPLKKRMKYVMVVLLGSIIDNHFQKESLGKQIRYWN
ncbi:hypothetical protein AAG906_013699 [Vitis piasezkii]